MLRTIGLISILVTTATVASESDRIDLLEKEIRDLKIRVLKLEEPQEHIGTKQDTPSSSEGWRSISNWRKLVTGMNPDTVRKILGEPRKVNGGIVAYWYYENQGKVTFVSDKVSGWEEPE